MELKLTRAPQRGSDPEPNDGPDNPATVGFGARGAIQFREPGLPTATIATVNKR